MIEENLVLEDIKWIYKEIGSFKRASTDNAFKALKLAGFFVTLGDFITPESPLKAFYDEAIAKISTETEPYFFKYRDCLTISNPSHGNESYFWDFIRNLSLVIETLLYNGWGITV